MSRTPGVEYPRTNAAVVGMYAPVTIVTTARMAYVAGQLSVDSGGEVVGAGDFVTQMRQVVTNLGDVLAAIDAGFEDIAKFTTYLVDERDIATFYGTREQLWPTLFPSGNYPPNTLLVVKRLVREAFRIEIEAIVNLGGGPAA
jgi:enamine deaminase RidA (YjgF/YER057c/UK114 family)